MTDVTMEELIEMRARLDALIGDAPAPDVPVEPPAPPAPPETYVMVDGHPVEAGLQPEGYSSLQGAYAMAPGPTPRIVIDMAAALPIAQDLIRQAREPAFARNDGEYMRAQQQGQDTSSFIAKGTLLRDAPADPRLASATTPAELLAAVDAVTAVF